jgi:hypothetical protein
MVQGNQPHDAQTPVWRIAAQGVGVVAVVLGVSAYVWLSTGGFDVGKGLALLPSQSDSTVTLSWVQLRAGTDREQQSGGAPGRVRVPGYMIPLDAPGSIGSFEFLLVPYFGACIHTPPPPPDQIIHVRVPAGTRLAWWHPVWVEGTLRSQSSRSLYATAGYIMFDAHVLPYEARAHP